MEMLQSQISLYREKIRFLEEIVLEEKENKNFWKLEETEMESYLREKQFVIFIDDPHYYFLVFYFYFYFINVIDYFEPYVLYSDDNYSDDNYNNDDFDEKSNRKCRCQNRNGDCSVQ
jgi:hypothetical protein